MWTLAFDMTTSFCSIALLKDEQTIDLFCETTDFGQSEILLPEIEKMLTVHDLTVQNLDLVAVCNGPGSFTGVRSCLSVAKAFKLAASHLNVTAVNAFDVYVHELTKKQISDVNIAVIETKRQDFYVGYYDKNLEPIRSFSTDSSDSVAQYAKKADVTLVGDGVLRLLQEQKDMNVRHIVCQNHLDIALLGRLAIERFKNNHLDFLHPLYLKAADVCVK